MGIDNINKIKNIQYIKTQLQNESKIETEYDNKNIGNTTSNEILAFDPKAMLGKSQINYLDHNNITIPEKYNFGSKYTEKNEREFWQTLYKQSPEKCEVLFEDKALFQNYPPFSHTQFIKAVDKLSLDKVKTTLNEINELYNSLSPNVYMFDNKETEIPQKPTADEMSALIILRANKPETYEFLLSYKNKDKIIDKFQTKLTDNNVRGSLFETLTPEQFTMIIGDGIDFKRPNDRKILINGHAAERRFVESSDNLSETDRENLKEYLSLTKTNTDVVTYRGEKDAGMFTACIIDNSLSLRVQDIVEQNRDKAKNIKITEFNGRYEKSGAKTTNLYDYIMNKDKLTLADALQVMKLGDEQFHNEIISLIGDTKITDTRFKSTSFDKEFAQNWTYSGEANGTKIFQTMNIKKGTEGAYSACDNEQVEFILNSTPKTISFQNAVYDEKTDTIILDSTVTQKLD